MNVPVKGRFERNTLINLAGSVLPLGLTLLTLPVYLRLIGDVRYGVLAIVWVLLGYFGLFDMGLGRATSRYIANLHGAPDQERESLFWTGLTVNAALGATGGLILWAAGRYLLYLFKMPEAMRGEVISGLPWLAAAVPVSTVVSVLIGALEGRERFLASNLLQLFGGAVFQVFPLSIAYWHGPDLKWLIGSAVASRVIASVPLFIACAKRVPLRGWPKFEPRWIRELFSFGGWLTISSLVNPFLTILDRFVIGAVRGAAAVTYYTIPNQFATKFSILPGSVTRTLFPRLAMEEQASNELAQRAVIAVAAVTMPLASIGILAIGPFFRLWLGPATAHLSSGAGEIMILGVWFNGIASIPFTLLLAQGRPDTVAKVHAAQVLPFIAVLWFGLHFGGVEGAAAAWTLRGGVDALLFFWMTGVPRRMFAAMAQPIALLVLSILCARTAGDSLLLHAVAAAVLIPLTFLWALRAVPDKFRQYADSVSGLLGIRLRSYGANT